MKYGPMRGIVRLHRSQLHLFLITMGTMFGFAAIVTETFSIQHTHKPIKMNRIIGNIVSIAEER